MNRGKLSDRGISVMAVDWVDAMDFAQTFWESLTNRKTFGILRITPSMFTWLSHALKRRDRQPALMGVCPKKRIPQVTKILRAYVSAGLVPMWIQLYPTQEELVAAISVSPWVAVFYTTDPLLLGASPKIMSLDRPMRREGLARTLKQLR